MRWPDGRGRPWRQQSGAYDVPTESDPDGWTPTSVHYGVHLSHRDPLMLRPSPCDPHPVTCSSTSPANVHVRTGDEQVGGDYGKLVVIVPNLYMRTALSRSAARFMARFWPKHSWSHRTPRPMLTLDNCGTYGGDPKRVAVVSYGVAAHLGSCVVLRKGPESTTVVAPRSHRRATPRNMTSCPPRATGMHRERERARERERE